MQSQLDKNKKQNQGKDQIEVQVDFEDMANHQARDDKRK
jgi:hypothetical protein